MKPAGNWQLWSEAACTPRRHREANLCDEDQDGKKDRFRDGVQLRRQLVEPAPDLSSHRCVKRIDLTVRQRDVAAVELGVNICKLILRVLRKRCAASAEAEATGQRRPNR